MSIDFKQEVEKPIILQLKISLFSTFFIELEYLSSEIYIVRILFKDPINKRS